ncbi:MAG: FG-GAP repeat domain-containing protein [Fimbriiglobus sp.]
MPQIPTPQSSRRLTLEPLEERSLLSAAPVISDLPDVVTIDARSVMTRSLNFRVTDLDTQAKFLEPSASVSPGNLIGINVPRTLTPVGSSRSNEGSSELQITLLPDSKTQSGTEVVTIRFSDGVNVGTKSLRVNVVAGGTPTPPTPPPVAPPTGFRGFPGGVQTTADVTGDGVADVIYGTAPGARSTIRIVDGANSATVRDISPFEPSYVGGFSISVGDLDEDGRAEIAVSPNQGGGPRVTIFRGSDSSVLIDFFGIDDPAFRGGARTAFGDVNGDQVVDLMVAAGIGGGPRVSLYDGVSLRGGGRGRLIPDFFAFELALRNGAYIALGDINGDGRADPIFGGGPGGGPRVRAFDAKTLLDAGGFVTLDALGGRGQIANFFAGDVTSRDGVLVSSADLNGDQFADLLTTPGGAAGSSGSTRYVGPSLRKL